MRAIHVEYLREALTYNPETGVLTWLERPLEHFSSASRRKYFNTRCAGRAAGVSLGYLNIRVTFGRMRCILQGHRVAWAISVGAWPTAQVDHIDGDPRNNLLSNLREATSSEQPQNLKLDKRNTSGFRGVSWHKKRGKWQAAIGAAGRRHHLGFFSTPELAAAAYLAAKQRYHFFQPVPRAA